MPVLSTPQPVGQFTLERLCVQVYGLFLYFTSLKTNKPSRIRSPVRLGVGPRTRRTGALSLGYTGVQSYSITTLILHNSGRTFHNVWLLLAVTSHAVQTKGVGEHSQLACQTQTMFQQAQSRTWGYSKKEIMFLLTTTANA